ncbi:BTAD domain-containing putative transcriptional regulator [Actinacidiphila sp. DG2A-62]|uniref:AfsR/SARP family transcriptional regulator n=1 Tax=Actinacidiphila sp. DG2A-62 TaxID=3108821 RepID=UPI002DB86519|nr:BTAD domain-containing putative transcriptional regulator [Actinacidiphila sp. DG2A-62]MEC3994695.1 BTAD domain-containing putative transcriptional regulator [Actinacidiphila sp. DG2A-62]
METRAAPAPGLRFAVLGPVRAWRDGEPIATGAPQQRALLAALLLRGGRTATASELLDAVWGESPPNTALAALRSYASRLRKGLGPTALVTDSGGYVLRVAPGALDAAVVEQLAVEAEKLRHSDPVRARELLGEALGLWHGEPLAGLPGPYAETQRARLAEWRLGLVEARLELDLDLGAHAEAVSELTALSAEHPLRERVRALLMLALYRSGRQAEALGVYADTRRLLAEELGIDPSAELADLHQRILEADAGLAAPAGGYPGAAGEPVRPAQLPATVADFTGRETVVRELGQQLAQASLGGGVMAVSAVAGIGGVGKTTLAVHVAHEARDAFPDGQLYVDLQGTDARPAEPEAVLGGFLRALGVPNPAIPDSLAERAALYRSTLDGRRVLALLDNAYDAAQIRQLLPGTPGCAALVTSRVRMVDLAGAHLVDLDVMSPEEALQLFTRIVGEERVAGERQAALDVVGACGFLPLAIRIAAARLAARRTWTVSVLARKLADHRRRLDELRAGDLAVKATFALGYGHLSAAQARAFRLLSLPDGPDISLGAAAAVLDLDPYTTEELLEALVDISLIESAAPARYRFHDLLRLYARECAERDELPEERCNAVTRLLDYYLASAASAYALERPGDRALGHLAPTTHPGLRFTERDEALEWLFSEAQALLAAIEQAAADGCPSSLRQAVDLLLATQDLMETGIYARQYQQAARAVVATAQELGEGLVEARGRIWLGQLLCLSGRFPEAEEEITRAHLLGVAAEDPMASSYAPNMRGIIALHTRRFEESAAYFTTALEAFRSDGSRYGEAATLSNLSRAQLELGDTEAALDASRQVVEIYRDLGAGFRPANGLYALGIALTATGRLDEALEGLTEALHVFREGRQQFWEGMTLFRLAKVHLAGGSWRQAASHAEQALVILRDVGGEWRVANALTVLGSALFGLGQPVRAHACWQDSLGIYTALGSPEAQEVRQLLGGDAETTVAV